jgi:hypothetical protein
MDAPSEPVDLTLQLPRDVYYLVIHKLRDQLAAISDSPEDLVRRDNAAIAQVAALLPANAEEAELAAGYIGALAYAADCRKLARGYMENDHTFALKCGAQATSSMREARATRTLLQRLQAERRKREADATALSKAEWTEHCAIGLMAQALGRPTNMTAPEPPPPPAPEPAPAPEAEPQPDPVAEAEFYAALYPQRAVQIRRHHGMPANATFPPPEDYILQALVTARTPALLALEQQAQEPATP